MCTVSTAVGVDDLMEVIVFLCDVGGEFESVDGAEHFDAGAEDGAAGDNSDQKPYWVREGQRDDDGAKRHYGGYQWPCVFVGPLFDCGECGAHVLSLSGPSSSPLFKRVASCWRVSPISSGLRGMRVLVLSNWLARPWFSSMSVIWK